MKITHSHPISDVINAINANRRELQLDFPMPTQSDLLVAVKLFEDLEPDMNYISEQEVPDYSNILSRVLNSSKPPQILEGLSYVCWYMADRARKAAICFRGLSVQIYKELVKKYKVF